MNKQQWTTVDKTGWGEGPWHSEPDKVQWYDDATGMACLIVRNRFGSLCGYVGVDPEHSLHGRSYDVDADVHGGLTYANICQEVEDESTGVCHVPAEGRSDGVWWFGFDCADIGDISPGICRTYWFGGDLYRTVEYVRSEVESLARQLAEAR